MQNHAPLGDRMTVPMQPVGWHARAAKHPHSPPEVYWRTAACPLLAILSSPASPQCSPDCCALSIYLE